MATYKSALIEALRGRPMETPVGTSVSFLPNPVVTPVAVTPRAPRASGIFNPAKLSLPPGVPGSASRKFVSERPAPVVEPQLPIEYTGGGGNDMGGGGDGFGTPGQGIDNNLADFGLALMAYGDLGYGLLPGGMAAKAAGNVIAGQQANAMGNAANTLAAIEAQDVPGIMSMSDKSGNVYSMSTPASIAAADAETFGTSLTPVQEQAATNMAAIAENTPPPSAPANESSTVIGIDPMQDFALFEAINMAPAVNQSPVIGMVPPINEAPAAYNTAALPSSLSPADQAIAEAIAAYAESAPADLGSFAGTGGNIGDSMTGGSTIGVDALGSGVDGGGGGGGGGGCFLTTAAVEHMGQPDDGDVLSTLRQFRDQIMLADDSKRADVAAYYKHAPQIVEAINARPDAKNVYREMYETYILPAVEAIKAGENDKAYKTYVDGVEWAMQQATNAQ